ncbi:unnamed protein product, partial [Echinostoma caproni]|uniref:Transcription cofactor vestigial-like protein 2 n=1 Tax=Echinostoma caproni TaxID=27848 RepID=A0A183BGX7_9TREM
EEDYDAVYRDSSLSFGPTICSFGLKYNDHNYAVPSGLTPPSMAPHLMDIKRPRERCSPDHRSDEASGRTDGETNVSYPACSSTSAAMQSASDGNASDSLTPSKDSVAGPWARKDTSLADSSLPSDLDSSGARGGKLAFHDLTEMRYEAELKVSLNLPNAIISVTFEFVI